MLKLRTYGNKLFILWYIQRLKINKYYLMQEIRLLLLLLTVSYLTVNKMLIKFKK